MRKFLTGTANTHSGAKFAREDILKDAPSGTIVNIGTDSQGMYLDILKPRKDGRPVRHVPTLSLVS